MFGLRALQGMTVHDAKGSALGRVTHVLLHPEDPVVVGIEVQPPNAAYVLTRKPRYVALSALSISDEGISLAEDAKEWTGARAEKALGFEWDKTVIWVGMPLVTESGERLGYVHDALFDPAEARVREVLVSEGLTADVAVGTRRLDGSQLVRFDGSAIVVAEAAEDAEFSGGLAAKAGTNVAVAKVVASEAGKTAAAIGGKALKAAAGSKTAKSTWAMFKETGKAFRDGMKGDDD